MPKIPASGDEKRVGSIAFNHYLSFKRPERFNPVKMLFWTPVYMPNMCTSILADK